MRNIHKTIAVRTRKIVAIKTETIDSGKSYKTIVAVRTRKLVAIKTKTVLAVRTIRR